MTHADNDRPPRNDESDLVRRISAALALQEQGIEIDLDTLCADRPELKPLLDAALAASDRLPGLHRASAGYDSNEGRLLSDRYELTQRIGAGTMGVVYRAEDRELGRTVAVKILRSDFLSGAEFEARFEREAEVLAAVRHHSVVTVYDRGRTEDGMLYLVMELLEGAPLSDLLEVTEEQAGTPPKAERIITSEGLAKALGTDALQEKNYVRQMLHWVAGLGDALQAAHDNNVLHRDVKPSNIFVRADGSVLLLDFGIAATSGNGTLATKEGALGTLSYMAPEQATGAEAGTGVDIYSLGATLYHCLTLNPPYQGAPSVLLTKLQNEDPPLASRLRPGLPRDIQAILDRALARDPRQRYETATAFAKDLRAFLDHRPVQARPISSLRRVTRRLSRSSTARGAAAAVVAGGLALGLLSWSAAATQASEQRADAHLASFGPTILVAPAQARRSITEEARSRYADWMDRAVELSTTPVPARAMRAAFRWDCDDREGAASDIAAIADAHSDSPFLATLADSYRSAAADTTADLNIDNLPEPISVDARYVAALHAARSTAADAAARVVALLPQDILGSAWHARELALQSRLKAGSASPGIAFLDVADKVLDDAVALEVERGRPSATTGLLRGICTQIRGRLEEAAAALEQAAALAPDDHGLRTTLAVVLRRLGRNEEAIEQARASLSVLPQSARANSTLANCLIASGRIEEADALVESPDFGVGARSDAQRYRVRAIVGTQKALELHMLAPTTAAARSAAETALQHIETSISLGGSDLPHERALMTAIAHDDTNGVLSAMLAHLATNPFDSFTLHDTCTLIDARAQLNLGLTENQTGHLLDALNALTDRINLGSR